MARPLWPSPSRSAEESTRLRFGVEISGSKCGNLGNGPDDDDLVVGVPEEDLGGVAGTSHGVVHVIYGSPTGLTSFGSQIWSLDSPGVPGSASTAGFFGETLG